MANSPDALREAVGRLENLQKLSGDATFPVGRLVMEKHRAKLSADIAIVLSALAEAGEALGPFAEACAHLHPSHPDDGVTLDGIEVRHWRRAAEVYRALAPRDGGGG